MHLDRLGISAVTTPQWSAWEDAARYALSGIHGIGLWRNKLESVPLESYHNVLVQHSLTVTNLCFTGQFTLGVDQAVTDGIQALNMASQLQASVVLVISGPIGNLTMAEADVRVIEGLRQLAPEAKRRGLRLALEALHPMDMTQWTVIPTVHKALDIIDAVSSEHVGLMLDLYNSWWDPTLNEAIARAGERILAVQIADWRNPTRSFTDRTIPGDGVAPLSTFIRWIEDSGYKGFYDLEIFSDEIWSMKDQYQHVIDQTKQWWERLEDRTNGV